MKGSFTCVRMTMCAQDLALLLGCWFKKVMCLNWDERLSHQAPPFIPHVGCKKAVLDNIPTTF